MVVLVPVEREDLKRLIELAFRDDLDLLTHYHISPGALDHCVQHTHSEIDKYYDEELYRDYVQAYEVTLWDPKNNAWVEVGYIFTYAPGDAIPQLYSFGINIHYRTKEVIGKWLEELNQLLGKCFFVQLWDKNTRAIEFFEKNDFVTTQKDGYKMLLRCQQED